LPAHPVPHASGAAYLSASCRIGVGAVTLQARNVHANNQVQRPRFEACDKGAKRRMASNGTPSIRLNRYLAKCGLGSRRSVEQLITGGKILVNGRKVTELSTTVVRGRDKVEYRGKHVEPVRELEYLAYHKPKGTVTTRSDPEGRKTVYDAIRERTGRDVSHLRHVGRLDLNSEGLLLLSNDGDLIHALTHPRYHVKKVYHVRISRPMHGADIEQMKGAGVESEGVILHAGSVRRLPETQGHWYEVALFEGKNRQIRRMFEALSYNVLRLRRVQFGVVRLGELPTGSVRALDEREIAGLKNLGYPVR
jgi:23S rRNA pseudouridine2605 synthase